MENILGGGSACIKIILTALVTASSRYLTWIRSKKITKVVVEYMVSRATS